MKNSIPFFFAVACSMLTLVTTSQVDVDKPITMSGSPGDRYITNLDLPVNDSDAANKEYVDSAVSAGGGSSQPTMISAESSTTMSYGAALRYCKQLTEGDYTDWYLPNEESLHYVLSKGGIPVANDNSANAVWFSAEWVGYGGTSWFSRSAFRLSDGSYATHDPTSSGSNYVRCVR